MRELKFRAFLFHTKEWIYFDLDKESDVPSGFYGGMSDWQQFVDMPDSKGVQMYEGDIIEYDDYYDGDYKTPGGYGVVRYDEVGFVIAGFDNGGYTDLWNCVKNWGGEVVGNIHEPPDVDENNQCLKCKRVRVGLKVGDMHDHIEICPRCGKKREMEVK